MDDPRAESRYLVSRRHLLAGAGLGAAAAIGGHGLARTASASPVQIVLRSDVPAVDSAKLDHLAQVLETQVTRDFAPYWGVSATFTVIESGTPVPKNGWPVEIVDASGTPQHVKVDNGGHWRADPAFCGPGPQALVVYDANESDDALTHAVSHECLEMLANPYLTAFWKLPSLDPGDPGDVLYSQEVCDPVWTIDFGYSIDFKSGPKVSDFITPRYFDLDRTQVPGTVYSFQGHATKPLDVAIGCNQNYFSFGRTIWRQMQMVSANNPIFSDMDTSNPNC